MDILVTTPLKTSEAAAAEAAERIASGGGWYARSFGKRHLPAKLRVGNKIFYIDQGHITGYAIVHSLLTGQKFTCEVTGATYYGNMAVMDAKSWRWIKKIPYGGFMGYRYFNGTHVDYHQTGRYTVEEIGGWLEPKPDVMADPVVVCRVA